MLTSFYAQYDQEKRVADIAKIHQRCAKLSKAKECQGSPAAELAFMLRAKYGDAALGGFSTKFLVQRREEL